MAEEQSSPTSASGETEGAQPDPAGGAEIMPEHKHDAERNGSDAAPSDGKDGVKAEISDASEQGEQGIVETDASELGDPCLPYPVVGVGASAGGLQAFRDMLDQLSPETGMSFRAGVASCAQP